MPAVVAAADSTIWAAVITVSASIIGGAFVMAWRLGSLTTKVNDLTDRLRTLEQTVRGIGGGRLTGGRRSSDL